MSTYISQHLLWKWHLRRVVRALCSLKIIKHVQHFIGYRDWNCEINQMYFFTSGPDEPIISKVSRSQNLTVLSAEPVLGKRNNRSDFSRLYFLKNEKDKKKKNKGHMPVANRNSFGWKSRHWIWPSWSLKSFKSFPAVKSQI